MIPLFLALIWPPFAAASMRHRSERAAALALARGRRGLPGRGDRLGLPACRRDRRRVADRSPPRALLIARPAYPSRREQRRQLLAQETAWAPAFERAHKELDSADKLVPVILRAPRRVP